MDDEIIYHYCSMESFFAIIKSKNIRLSNAYKTNDSAELEWIFSIMKNSLPEGFVDKLGEEFAEEFVHSLKSSYKKWMEDYFQPHIACFSKNGDLLSQWRGYSNNGKGISIGFNRNYFEAIRMLDNKEFKISDVIYDLKIQEDMLRKFFSSDDGLGKIKDVFTKSKNDYFVLEFAFVGELLKFGMYFKNKCFSEESEVRLIHGFNEIAAEPDIFEYRATSDDLISFVELPIDIENDHPPIKEIILGPNCKVNSKSVQHFLELNSVVNSIGIDIKKSNSSYQHS